MRTEIKKAKLKDRSLIVELVEYVDIDGAGTITNEVTKSCGNLVHDDLIIAFDNLKKHLVKICDMRGSEMITYMEDFDNGLLNQYNITGFSIGGNDGNDRDSEKHFCAWKAGRCLRLCGRHNGVRRKACTVRTPERSH